MNDYKGITSSLNKQQKIREFIMIRFYKYISENNLILLLFIINALYWGFSEVYIHGGTFISGFIQGVLVSVVCAGVPLIIFRRWK